MEAQDALAGSSCLVTRREGTIHLLPIVFVLEDKVLECPEVTLARAGAAQPIPAGSPPLLGLVMGPLTGVWVGAQSRGSTQAVSPCQLCQGPTQSWAHLCSPLLARVLEIQHLAREELKIALSAPEI